MYRIGLDLRGTEDGFKSHSARGTGRYIRGVFGGLSEIRDPQFGFVPFYQHDVAIRPWQRRLIDLTPAGKATLETQLFLSQALERQRFDLIHFFAHGDAPARLRSPYVVTVLDLIPLRFPELYKADRLGLRFRFARFLELESIRRAVGILAISEATKRDLQEILNIPAEKIVVTPLAADDRFFEPRDRDESSRALRARFGIRAESPVLLYVGGIDPRKNVPFLLEVFAEMLSRRNVPEATLLLVGKYDKNREYEPLRQQISRLGLSDRVILTGFVADEELPTFYAGATLSVFPSLYEGFGLPVLESLAVGTFVVCGNNSSLPEVTGPDYPLVEGTEREAWIAAIERALQDSAYRKQHSMVGQGRARGFSWANTAQKSIDGYSRFLGEMS